MAPNESNSQRRGQALNACLGVVCVAGGCGRRYGGDKLAEDLNGRPVLERALAAVVRSLATVVAVVVAPSERVSWWRDQLSADFPEVLVVAGGERRQDSVRIGVELVAEHGATVAVIHDAARPLIHPDDVLAVVSALGDGDGAILCGLVSDTIKQVAADGTVTATIDRACLRLAQTPQVFRVDALCRAWREAPSGREWTDEAALLEHQGCQVRTVLATHPNPKLTTSSDLHLLRSLWEHRA